MNKHLLDNDSVHKTGYSPEYTLTGWLEATANFQLCYRHLITYVSQRQAEQDLGKGKGRDTGQFPLGQLQKMVIGMRREVEKLAQDIDQGSRVTKLPVRKNYKKLATHTLVLNQLTYQAQLRLDLSAVSAS